MTHKEYLIDRMRWAMGLYGIMNCFDRKEGDMAYQAFAAMRGGMKMIQLRECKNIDIDEFLPNARLISHEIERNGGVMIVNNDTDLAQELDGMCHGVHLGQNDMPIAEARAILGDDMIIGATAHNIDEALKAQADGADYLGVGDIFGSATKNDTMRTSIDTLREICHSVQIPVVAIGGINEDNILSLKGSGISGVAVSKALFGMPLPQEFSDAESQFRNHSDYEDWASDVRHVMIRNAAKNLYEKAKIITAEDVS